VPRPIPSIWATVPSVALKRKQRWIVDALDRVIEAQGSTTDKRTLFAYDAAGRQTLATDANSVPSLSTYDDLDRLVATVADSASGGIQASTGMAYDAAGNLRAVVDPKGLTTSYVYDALGRMTQQISPDSGTTNYTYDDTGNRTSMTDARGITVTTSYDALNRPLTMTYPTAAENVSYSYDTPHAVCQAGETFSIGRLSQMTDQSGTTAYCYDRFGNLTRKVQTTGGVAHTVRYSYTLANQLATQTYPDGTVVDYTRDTQSRVQEIGVTVTGGTRQVLLNNAKYLPAGPASSWQYGNGRTLTRGYDQDYRATSLRDPGAGGLDIGYVYDSASDLKQITTQSTAIVRAKFEYDALGRLLNRKNATDVVQESYSYDQTGNRLTAGEWQTVPDPNGPPGGGGGTIDLFVTSTYGYAADSHRLTALDGTPRGYSANGNLINIGDLNGPGGPVYQREYLYNDANRMRVAKQSGNIAATYVYNGFGEQVQRQTSVTTRFVYDEAGQLLGQYNNAGQPIQQYLWLGGQPVGVIVPAPPPQEGQPVQPAKLWYVQSDALGSPRSIIDPTRNLAVWRWDETKETFGDHAPNTDPDNDGTHVQFDLRFPGQRYDQASGLHYNYMRDYDPATGRYTQSDPIGLIGGLSTYAYAGSMPTGAVDPKGLISNIVELADAIGFDPSFGMSQSTVDFIAGTGDALSTIPLTNFSISAALREAFGGDSVNKCSDAYRYGQWAGVGLGFATGGGLIKSGLSGLKAAANSMPRMVRVTSWADKGIRPDLNPGRWVQLGAPTRLNFWLTGLPGPKAWFMRQSPFFRAQWSRVPFSNSITAQVPATSLRWPSGFDAWRGLFGQRILGGG
jgi:RHS repeat-associated protein